MAGSGSLSTLFHAVVNSDWSFFRIIFILAFIAVAYPSGYIFYNLFLHPLRSYPGPRLYAASIIPITILRLQGKILPTIQAAHKKYGAVVRLAPNELSYVDVQAWKDIYGHRKPGQPIWPKDLIQGGPEQAGTPGIFRSEGADHTSLKRTFAHAFSDKALKEQQELIRGHALSLVDALKLEAKRQASNGGEGVEMVKMYNFVAFDLLSDLTFGKTLGLLENGEYIPWVHAMIGHVKAISVMHAIARWPILARFMMSMLPASARQMRIDHVNFCIERVEERMALQDTRPDFWSLIVEAGTHRDISKQQLYAVMGDFMFAGTETTATALSAITFYLCKHPSTLQKLVAELRQFEKFEDLNLNTMQALPYLNACLDESFRIYPPVPVGNMRLAPTGGALACGKFVPAGTTVEVGHYAINHSPLNFTDPDDFVPERFLKEPPRRYLNDVRGASNPFSMGPRACIGKNLALHQVRMLIVAVLWHFDLSLVDPGFDWPDQEVHELWLKKDLWVKLTTRE